jgi:hypothetical protein
MEKSVLILQAPRNRPNFSIFVPLGLSMTKHGWMLWLAPIAVWAVYMCWLTGFQSGYEAGHNDGWDTARRSFMPVRIVEPDRAGMVQREISFVDDPDSAQRPR